MTKSQRKSNITAFDNSPTKSKNGVELRSSGRLREKRQVPDSVPEARPRPKSPCSSGGTASSSGSSWNEPMPARKKPKVSNAGRSLLKVNNRLPSHQSKISSRAKTVTEPGLSKVKTSNPGKPEANGTNCQLQRPE